MVSESSFAFGSLAAVSTFIFMVGVALLLCWHAWRIFKEPVNPFSADSPLACWDDLRSTSFVSADDLAMIQAHSLAGDHQSALQTTTQLLNENPVDPAILWLHAEVLLAADQPAAAEATYARLLARLSADDPSLSEKPTVYFNALAKRLHAIMLQNDGRFETECQTSLRTIVSDQSKVTLLDQLACIPLFETKPQIYDLTEFCIRKALVIAPGTLTLQGTLGALLIERGNFSEGEPLIRECYNRSSALHDRGICSYYLALIAEKNGDRRTARKLAKQSIALHPEPWLTAKAKTLLHRLGS